MPVRPAEKPRGFSPGRYVRPMVTMLARVLYVPWKNSLPTVLVSSKKAWMPFSAKPHLTFCI